MRASAGALFQVPVRRGDAAAVQAAGFDLVVADTRGRPLAEWTQRPRRLALVVGNEPRGVADDVLASADATVAVPLRAGVESLNVAVAAGILMHGLVALPVAS